MKITQVLKEAEQISAAFAFGRFNPAHQGHIEVWRTVENAAARWYIGTNPSTLGPNDPLTFQQKSAWMSEIYQPVTGHIAAEQSVMTLAAKIFADLGKNEAARIAYITDADDWAWSGKLLNQYNGVAGAHGYYKFAEIVHVPSPRVSSATALRDAARADDKVAFYQASGTDPKLKVAGLTYFDTVKQAVTKYPLPVKKAKKVKEQGVAEGSGKNVVKSIKVGNFRHDLVDTGFGWQVRIYNGDELYYTDMSKNTEQKGLAALEDAVAYTEKQTRTKRQGVVEGPESEKIAGRYDPADFDSMVQRLAKVAKSGPMKTVWDPVKQVYKTVPDTDKQKKIAEAVIKVVEVIKQRKSLWRNK